MSEQRERKNNTAILFKNHKKEKDTQPDYKGEALVVGKWFWLDAWIKSGKKEKYMSLSLTLKDVQKSRFDHAEAP